MTVRAQSIPARHYFAEHMHHWNQMVYAISGVLTVAVEGRSFVISPEQAVWLPTGLRHRVGSLIGAEFRSLWIAEDAGRGLPASPTVFGVMPLLKALVVEATELEGEEDHDGYANRVTGLILDQLRRARAPRARSRGRAGDHPWRFCARRSTRTRPTRVGRRHGVESSGCRNGPWPAASRRRWA